MKDTCFYFGMLMCAFGITFGINVEYINNTALTCDGECMAKPLSLLQCATVCSQTSDCKGVSFDRGNKTCCVCSSFGISENGSDPGSALYRDTSGSCVQDLVKDIPDAQITASSSFDIRHGTSRARLNTANDGGGIGAWCAESQTSNEYIQARFNGVIMVNGVGTQGRSADSSRVESYNVGYSSDCVTFSFIEDDSNQPKVFPGNYDSDTIVWNDLEESIYAVCVRIQVVTLYSRACVRFGIKGCGLGL